MNISFRVATTDDAPVITGFTQQLGYTPSERLTVAYLDEIAVMKDTIVLVATTNNNTPIGRIQVSDMLRLESGRFCEIVGLVVDEQYRGQGIGKQLVEQAKQWCGGRSCSKLRVRTNVTRKDTHRFYTNAGFTEIKEQKMFELEI